MIYLLEMHFRELHSSAGNQRKASTSHVPSGVVLAMRRRLLKLTDAGQKTCWSQDQK